MIKCEYCPLVSVVIPNYCHSKYLEQRIESVINQTYKNIEIIILDDCSPDEGASKAVIEKYRNKPLISHIVYNEVNSGSTFKQWNKGIVLAKGELVWIAESDDFAKETMLEELVPLFVKYPNISIAYTTPQFVDEEGREIETYTPNLDETFWKGHNFICQMMAHTCAIWNASATIFRRDTALKVDDLYMSMQSAGDRLFWIMMAERGNVVYYPQKVSYMRRHGNEVTARKRVLGITSSESYYVNKYMEDKGLLNLYYRLKARHYALNDVEHWEYYTPEIRKKLHKLWTYNGIVPSFVIHMMFRVLNKFVRE